MGYVAVNLGGVAPRRSTVQVVARANAALAVQHRYHRNQPQPALVAAMSAASSALHSSINYLNIETMAHALVVDSTLTMLFLLQQGLSMALVPQEMMPLAKGSLQPSLVKPLMKAQVLIISHHALIFLKIMCLWS